MPSFPVPLGARSTPWHHRMPLGLAIGLVVAGVLVVLGVILLVLFLIRKRSSGEDHPRRSPNINRTTADSSPYGPPVPRYKHVPGTNMRIAHRDWDGSWKLSDPGTPFTPSGISEVSPSPSSSTFPLTRRLPDESVESLSVTRGYNGYHYGVPLQDDVIHITHTKE